MRSQLFRGAGRLLTAAEHWVERRLARRRFRLGRLRQPELQPYLGYGTPTELRLKGRVLEQRGLLRATPSDTRWHNLRNMLRRFETDEIAEARVRVRLDTAPLPGTGTSTSTSAGARAETGTEPSTGTGTGTSAGTGTGTGGAGGGDLTQEVVSDQEGYFDVTFRLPAPLPAPTAWHEVELELLHPLTPDHHPVRTRGAVLAVHDAPYGVISDLDDTVVRSGVTDLSRMAWIALTSNAHTRLPFPGVAELYQAFRRGGDGRGANPVFYVSSSPWNLHDMLVEFMDLQGVPRGPLFLRDWSPLTVKGGGTTHKLAVIRQLLATYPGLPFVLVGDSGEHDPEIYAQVAREQPGRVRVIYIRDVTTSQRHQEVLTIAADLRGQGVEMLLASDTAQVAAHARDLGLTAPATTQR